MIRLLILILCLSSTATAAEVEECTGPAKAAVRGLLSEDRQERIDSANILARLGDCATGHLPVEHCEPEGENCLRPNEKAFYHVINVLSVIAKKHIRENEMSEALRSLLRLKSQSALEHNKEHFEDSFRSVERQIKQMPQKLLLKGSSSSVSMSDGSRVFGTTWTGGDGLVSECLSFLHRFAKNGRLAGFSVTQATVGLCKRIIHLGETKRPKPVLVVVTLADATVTYTARKRDAGLSPVCEIKEESYGDDPKTAAAKYALRIERIKPADEKVCRPI